MSAPSDEELLFPQWQAPLQELILEFDRGRLAERIHHVEELISSRLRELLDEHESHREREALESALSIVRLVKRDRLDIAE
jgi:hypothetical protein